MIIRAHTDQARFTSSCSQAPPKSWPLVSWSTRSTSSPVSKAAKDSEPYRWRADSSRPASTSRQVSRSSGMPSYW